MVSDSDLSNKVGLFVRFDSGKIAVVDAITDIPVGILGHGHPYGGSVILPIAPGTVYMKLDATPGTVTPGTVLVVTATGTVAADPGTGDRVQVAIALEAGVADEKIEAQLIHPVALVA